MITEPRIIMQGLWRAERVRSTEKCGLWTLELVVVGVELGAPTAPIEQIRGSKQTRARFNPSEVRSTAKLLRSTRYCTLYRRRAVVYAATISQTKKNYGVQIALPVGDLMDDGTDYVQRPQCKGPYSSGSTTPTEPHGGLMPSTARNGRAGNEIKRD